MSLNVTYASTLSTKETLADTDLNSSQNAVTHDGYSTSATANGGSSPAVSARAKADTTLTVGAATIDLTSLVGTNGVAVSGSGLRVQFIKLIANANNANPITIGKGASNGYDGFGASFSLALAPGGEALIRTKAGGSVIGGTNKTLDLSGAGSQGITGEIVMG